MERDRVELPIFSRFPSSRDPSVAFGETSNTVSSIRVRIIPGALNTDILRLPDLTKCNETIVMQSLPLDGATSLIMTNLYLHRHEVEGACQHGGCQCLLSF